MIISYLQDVNYNASYLRSMMGKGGSLCVCCSRTVVLAAELPAAASSKSFYIAHHFGGKADSERVFDFFLLLSPFLSSPFSSS